MSYTNPDKVCTSPLDAIKEYCIDCCGGDRQWVKECPSVKCALHEFRFGKNPYRKTKTYSDEQKAELRERITKAREAKKS